MIMSPALADSLTDDERPISTDTTPRNSHPGDDYGIVDQLIFLLPDSLKERFSIFVPEGASPSDSALEKK